jgi:predicted nucleotidyltransferase
MSRDAWEDKAGLAGGDKFLFNRGTSCRVLAVGRLCGFPPGGYICGMRRNEAIARLKEIEPAVRALGAASLFLFGSHARDEARSDSDVDVFIDKDPSRDFGFDEFMGIYLALRKALGVEVGYSTREGLVEHYRNDIEREAIRVF